MPPGLMILTIGKPSQDGDLRLHWYGKDQAFAQTMLDAGVEGLRRNKEQAGLITNAPD